MLAVELASVVVGLSVLVACSVRQAANSPGRRISIGATRPLWRRYLPLSTVGVGLTIFGGIGLRHRFGVSPYLICLVLMVAAAWIPVFVHNRSIGRERT